MSQNMIDLQKCLQHSDYAINHYLETQDDFWLESFVAWNNLAKQYGILVAKVAHKEKEK